MIEERTVYQVRRYRDYKEQDFYINPIKEDVCFRTFTDEQKCIDFINSMELNDYQWEDWGTKATTKNLYKTTFSAKGNDTIANKYLGPYDKDLIFHVVRHVIYKRV